ncbi:2-oxo-4-hydroxy-4-carboxy-5-ureidoimidazoline decarboxylase [Paenibacillus sp. NFR01]|uniref:2-oxo-4-hydroxy-4-carboxy-5-ureidoimidazoline decarboxylase n=1 Tax=Paenibacillus sp. NFR01 TaxID=1566279 RepID=UPI0008B35C71|nr:2-oxo-4-hydroxy-4-carboxy-5-ureidoimidazoline decarboxylase [Paenibacillus sp. NFR01]SET92023.1 2-oxo-4-hydroxy-4-carboxy-5-ureidoimidazoline decarboxylase [Paenibacillus sp. NFR01]
MSIQETLTVEQINAMDQESFTKALGGIFEHSPWVAEAAYRHRPFASAEVLHEAMLGEVREAGEEKILELLRAHPDLATRLKVTPLSAAEQQGAGLDRLTPEEFAALTELNAAYTAKFGFPFILAVRGKTKEEIIVSISSRVLRAYEDERAQALTEIGKITGFRLSDLFQLPGGSLS